jgi:hypothetical protein
MNIFDCDTAEVILHGNWPELEAGLLMGFIFSLESNRFKIETGCFFVVAFS